MAHALCVRWWGFARPQESDCGGSEDPGYGGKNDCLDRIAFTMGFDREKWRQKMESWQVHDQRSTKGRCDDKHSEYLQHEEQDLDAALPDREWNFSPGNSCLRYECGNEDGYGDHGGGVEVSVEEFDEEF